jgi:hypothetical protein
VESGVGAGTSYVVEEESGSGPELENADKDIRKLVLWLGGAPRESAMSFDAGEAATGSMVRTLQHAPGDVQAKNDGEERAIQIRLWKDLRR